MLSSVSVALLFSSLGLAQLAVWETGIRERNPSARNDTAHPLGGIVRGVAPGRLPDLRIELIDLHSRSTRAESMVSGNGMFSLGTVPLGIYELRVSTLLGGVLYSREIHTGSATPLDIVLPTIAATDLPPISMQRLQHKIPKAAEKKMREAEKLFRQGKEPEARQRVAEAVALDPEYFEALANLGALELLNHENDKAIEHLERALAIEPAAHLVAANLSAAHMIASRYTDAEAFARQSLRYQPGCARSRYLLALSLLKQNKNVPEALGHLEKAKGDFGPAQELWRRLQP